LAFYEAFYIYSEFVSNLSHWTFARESFASEVNRKKLKNVFKNIAIFETYESIAVRPWTLTGKLDIPVAGMESLKLVHLIS
jgi:hypothetical protein